MIALAAAWIIPLLAVGGVALERVLVGIIVRNFDAQLEFTLAGMVNSADLDETGAVRFLRSLGDQRFSEPYSGLYWQVSADSQPPFPSRSLWDRVLAPAPGGICVKPCNYATDIFRGEPLRVVGRTVRMPGSSVHFYFQVAQSTRDLAAQTGQLRTVLFWSLGLLGIGLLALAALQSTYGLSPLGRVSRAIAAVRSGKAQRVPEDFPIEIAPLVSEINELLDYTEQQRDAARRHAGNLAHALKTPMSVLIGEAQDRSDPLALVIATQVQTMRRHVDHQLARARAAGQRGTSSTRTEVWPAIAAIVRTVGLIHADSDVSIDMAGDKTRLFRGEREDLDEMVGNLVDNAAIHGGGRVFVTIGGGHDTVEICVEDDGPGIPESARDRLFERGERLDTEKPGTGLGLAIALDVAELYGGTIEVESSEDLGGLLIRLTLPAAL